MRFDVVTLFPQAFEALRVSHIWTRAETSGLIELRVHDLRDYAEDRHRRVDDIPYGGGPGMVLKMEPLVEAVEEIKSIPGCKVLFSSPQGKRLTQSWAKELANSPQLLLLSGRYEGADERFIEGWVDDCFSIGDYVLSSGDLPAMVLVDTVARLIPGVVGDEESVATDSFTSGALKYPQYTRPAEFRGKEVPKVLLSGNHAEILAWRKSQSSERTRNLRPELFEVNSCNKPASEKDGK